MLSSSESQNGENEAKWRLFSELNIIQKSNIVLIFPINFIKKVARKIKKSQIQVL